MAGHINFEGTAITNIISEIDIKKARDYNTSPFIGGSGSNTDFISQLGRVLTFKSIVTSYEELNDDGTVMENPPIKVYEKLAEDYKSKTGVLTSESHIDLKSNYLCTGFNVIEDTGGNFTIDWEFTEVLKFNKVKPTTFRVWGSAAQSTNSKKQSKTSSKTSGNKVNKTSKALLTKCGTLSPSNKVSKCVKYLQKFMQSLGYYKKYKIDGIYAQYTKAELKKLQKAKKLSQTGKWDKKTIAYFKKKYKLK